MTVTFAETILTGSIFSCSVLFLRFILQKHLPNALFYWLWNVAGILLIVPLRIPCPVSLSCILSGFRGPDGVVTGALTNGAAGGAARLLQAGGRAAGPPPGFTAVCLLGSLLIAFLLAADFLVWRMRFCGAVPAGHDVRSQLAGVSKLPVYLTGAVNTPCVCGLFKSSVYFPAGWDFSRIENARMAFYHEAVHVLHRDNLRKAVFLLSICIQWYNPFAWLNYFFACRDMELYCDECVISRFGTNARAPYALMLLSEPGAGAPAPGVCLSKRAIQERIVFIMKPKRNTASRKLSAVLAFVTLMLVFATGAAARVMPQDTASPSLGNRAAGGPANGALPVVRYDGSPLRLANGAILALGEAEHFVGRTAVFSLVPVEGYLNGQTVSYGYLIDGTYRALGIFNISDATATTFPEADGTAGTICIRSSCPDTIYIDKIETYG